jgi:hypothetical protein
MSLAESFLNLEGLFWSKVYTRRDQDRNRYLAYLDAEESLSQRSRKSLYRSVFNLSSFVFFR